MRYRSRLVPGIDSTNLGAPENTSPNCKPEIPRTLHPAVAQGGRVPHEALEADGESDARLRAPKRPQEQDDPETPISLKE